VNTAQKSSHPYTRQEYLNLEEQNSYKSEFYNGEIYAMSGGTRNHNLISTNLIREIGVQLKGSRCKTFSSDLKIHIAAANSFVYPDVFVVCGEEAYYEDRPLAVTNPILIVEVLSESTANWDRSGKFRLYEQLDSLEEYMIVEQNLPQIDVFRRNAEGLWVLEHYDGLEASIELKSVGVQLPAHEIYSNIVFPPHSPRNAPSGEM